MLLVNAKTGKTARLPYKGPKHTTENLEDHSYFVGQNILLYTQIDQGRTREELIDGNTAFAGDQADAETRIFQYYSPVGENIWERTFDGSGNFETEIIGDSLIVASGNKLYSIDTQTGDTEWRQSLGNGIRLRSHTDQKVTVVAKDGANWGSFTRYTVDLETGDAKSNPRNTNSQSTTNSQSIQNWKIKGDIEEGGTNFTITTPNGSEAITFKKNEAYVWELTITKHGRLRPDLYPELRNVFLEMSQNSRQFAVYQYSIVENTPPNITLTNKTATTEDNLTTVVNITDEGVPVSQRTTEYSVSWALTRNESAVASGENQPDYQFDKPGEYQLQVSVTDSSGATANKTLEFAIQEQQSDATTIQNSSASSSDSGISGEKIPGFSIPASVFAILGAAFVIYRTD